MLIIISPAKILNLKPQTILKEHTLPEFTERSALIMHELKKLKPSALMKLLDVNRTIADINYRRHMDWSLPFTPENSKQALLTFNGEVYRGLNATSFTTEDFVFAQSHLRILSGLYGLIRPLDLIQPYRLEMGIKLKTPQATDIYKFWGDSITKKLNEAFSGMKHPVLINLASHEYAKVILMKQLKAPVINIEFWEGKDNAYKTIVVYTKKARGMLSRFIIKNKLTRPGDLKAFDDDGYIFNPRYSKDDTWVFTRK